MSGPPLSFPARRSIQRNRNRYRNRAFSGNYPGVPIIAHKYLLALAIALMASTSAVLAKDNASGAFLKKAIEGNYAEVRMGELAQKNSQRDDVKAFGQTLVNDHDAANQKAIDAAKSMNINPPTGPNAKQEAEYDKMSKMTGAKFDKMFASHMVSDHEKDIAEYKKESRMKNAAGEYAAAEIPTLEKHLDAAKSLSSSKSK
jgi:putative membrane protein